jgi:hypothetical protein
VLDRRRPRGAPAVEWLASGSPKNVATSAADGRPPNDGMPAVDDALVVEVLVAEPHDGVGRQGERRRRVHAERRSSAPWRESAERSYTPLSRTAARAPSPCPIVERGAAMVERAAVERQRPRRCPLGRLRHAVDHAPPPPPRPERHRVRALERLDAVGVVQVAQVLRVVAHAVDEEVAVDALPRIVGARGAPPPAPS